MGFDLTPVVWPLVGGAGWLFLAGLEEDWAGADGVAVFFAGADDESVTFLVLPFASEAPADDDAGAGGETKVLVCFRYFCFSFKLWIVCSTALSQAKINTNFPNFREKYLNAHE